MAENKIKKTIEAVEDKILPKNEAKVEKDKLTAPIKLKILFTIVERQKADFFMSALEGFDVNFQTVMYGKGTSTQIKKLVGFEANNKAVIISLVQANKVKQILAAYEDKYFKTRNGKGVAFTVSLKSVIGKMAYNYLANLGGR